MTIGVRLGDELEARLDALAKRSGRTKTYYVRKALEEMIEDFEDMQMAVEALEDPRDDIPMEQVMKKLGITYKELDNVDLSDVD